MSSSIEKNSYTVLYKYQFIKLLRIIKKKLLDINNWVEKNDWVMVHSKLDSLQNCLPFYESTKYQNKELNRIFCSELNFE